MCLYGHYYLSIIIIWKGGVENEKTNGSRGI